MLARLEAAFEREHRFVDDASHELHTPLAILKASRLPPPACAAWPDPVHSGLRSSAQGPEKPP
jgi:hypothetical protein